MLISHKLHTSIDSMLEALDQGNVRLILEANAKFVEGVKGLKSSIEQFSKLVGEAGVEGLKPTYEALYKEVQELEGKLDEVPDSFSYKDQLKLLAPQKDDAAPEAMVTKIALAHDANVSGMKDAIIEISKVLEGMKEIFSVGSKGIFLQPEFQKLVTLDPAKLNLALFATEAPYLLSALGGLDAPKNPGEFSEEELMKAKEHWNPLWNKDGNQGDDKWEAFIGGFDKVSEGMRKAYEAAGKAIQNAKPSPEFQAEAPKEGILASLMGGIFGSMKGGSDIKADPKLIMGKDDTDENGLLSIPFEKLSKLVSGLIEMSGNATEAASGAMQSVKNNQEENKPPDGAAELKKFLIDEYDEDDSDPKKHPQAFKAMLAFEQIFGGPEKLSIKGVKEKANELKGLLEKVEVPKGDGGKAKLEEAEIDRLLEIFEIDGDDEEEEEITPIEFDGKKHRTNELNDYLKKNLGTKWGREDVEFAFQVLKDEGLINLREGLRDSKADFKKEFLEKVKAKIEGGNMKPDNKKKSLARFDDKALEVLWKYFKEKGVELNESVVFQRWGVLAGIIKG